jgi:phosphatidylinositol-3-phosphatase
VLRRFPIALAVALAILAPATLPGAAAGAANSPCGRTKTTPSWSHLIVIAFENHSYSSVLGAGAPKSEFTKLAGECGVATHFTASHFPHSLPTYIASTSGQVSITGDCLPGPSCQSTAKSIFSQLGPAGWRAFGQSMPAPCAKTSSGDYVTRHLPPLYYTRTTHASCVANVLPLPNLVGQLGRRFTWIAPDEQRDMEVGTPAQASTWLHAVLEGSSGILTHKPYTQGHTAVFIWFDTGANSDTVSTPLPFIVITPSTPHVRSAVALNDFSALRVWERMLGVSCLKSACTAPGMGKPFHL